MICYVDEIEALFDLYEEEHLTEKEIFQRTIELVISHEFEKDYMYDLNDTLFNRGYSFQFDVKREKLKFDSETYYNLITNVTKSKDKTNQLITYLREVGDRRLTLSSIHLLKIRYLIDLEYLPNDNDLINQSRNMSLKDFFNLNFYNKEIKNMIIKLFTKLGILYAELNFDLFAIEVEHLLWTIERDDNNYGYLKVNTLKVALNIAPKEYFEKDGKQYYNPKFSKVTKDYLKLIDKNEISKIKARWGSDGYETDNSGYRLLYKIL